MKTVGLIEIRERAHACKKAGEKWHFHILTPTCALNKNNQYAVILECPDKNEQLVYYSDKAEKELGEELAPMLHGSKVLDKGDDTLRPSPQIQHVVERAKSLKKKNIEWHHHVLFPGCIFNTNSPKFTFIFEDPEADNIALVSDKEPTADLKLIEPLFYKK
jgi:hypothetical protein